MSFALNMINILMLISLAMVVYRLVTGPSLADRAIASDQIAIHVIALIAIYSIATNQETLIDLVIVSAIVGFLSVALIGIYMERAARGKAQVED